MKNAVLRIRFAAAAPVGVTAAGVFLAGLLCSGTGCSGGPPGRAVYEAAACPQCHGIDRAGTRMGPALTNVAEVWTRDELRRYIADPGSMIETTDRLRAMTERYPARMPQLRIEEERLDELVDYLLGR